jgi:cytochrome P450
MRELVHELVDAFAPTGQCEFMVAFADRYPIQVICHLLGVPREDHELFARWGDALTYVLSLELSMHLDEVNDALDGLTSYLDELLTERSSAPRDDLLGQLLAVAEDGDRLSRDELVTMIASLLFAGFDTTRNQLAIAMVTFAEHRDQWALLAEQPALAGRAVEEVLRFGGPISVTGRVAREDVDVDGWRVPAATMVMLSLAAANHDPAAFDRPHELDVTATREPHSTFGGGPHYCLGANLARAELQEALPVLARRLRDPVVTEEPEWRSATGIVGPRRLPLRFEPS